MNSNNSLPPEVAAFFDEDSNTFSYVVRDPSSKACAIIDSVLNFDYASGSYTYTGADAIRSYIESHQLSVAWHIETHVHADHLSAAPYLKKHLGGSIGIGDQIATVQHAFSEIFNEDENFKQNGSQFDHLFADGDTYKIGGLSAVAIHTPGHTPACMVHVIGDAAFVGDTIFMPDAGTARADFPGGSAKQLFDSAQKILSLPENTRLFMCHDYGPNGREVDYKTTVAEQRQNNIHVNTQIDAEHFIQMREKRDRTLAMPRLIFPSIQVNMRAGYFPKAEDNGVVYLKVPINQFS